MKVGDLVIYQNTRWSTIRVDDDTRMALLVNQEGGRIEVPDTIDEDTPDAIQVLANPPTEWPMVAFPTKRGTGPIVEITLPGPTQNHLLVTWGDWVPSDPVREGGSLYFNPDLNFRQGEILIAKFRNGTRGRITISRNFGTVAKRVAAATAPKVPHEVPEERNRFNRDVFMKDEE